MIAERREPRTGQSSRPLTRLMTWVKASLEMWRWRLWKCGDERGELSTGRHRMWLLGIRLRMQGLSWFFPSVAVYSARMQGMWYLVYRTVTAISLNTHSAVSSPTVSCP